MPELLDDLRVIDLSEGPIGGMATMVLADFGADVVKVERPGGDPWRTVANAPMWLRGKRSAVLDLTTEPGRESLARLAESADVVVTSMRPGKAESLGAGCERLSAANPALVYCAITGFGAKGPYVGYPGYDFNRLGQAMEDAGLTCVAPVGNAIARLIPAGPMRAFATGQMQREPDYLLQRGSGVTPLRNGFTLSLPRGELSVVDPGEVFDSRST